MPPRVALFGLFGVGNFGNEGSLEAVSAAIRSRRPDVRLSCICAGPAEVTQRFNLSAVPIRPAEWDRGVWWVLNRATFKLASKICEAVWLWRQVGKVDAIIVPGTGILDDFGERPFGMPYSLMCLGLACRLRRRPLHFLSIGAGPIQHPISRLFMKTSAACATSRSFRDEASRAFMEQIGLDCRSDRVLPDVAFMLDTPEYIEPADARYVGLGVMNYKGWGGRDVAVYRRHVVAIAEIAEELVRRGYDVRLVRGELGDSQAIDDVLQVILRGGSNGIFARIQVDPARNLKEVMRAFGAADVVVATRFHNLVCALATGRPTYAFTYGLKNQELLAAVGLHAYMQSADAIQPTEAIDEICKLIDDRSQVSRNVSGVVAGFRRQLNAALDDLCRFEAQKGFWRSAWTMFRPARENAGVAE